MKLNQFDRLKRLLTELEDKTLQLKQQNFRLERENISLKSTIAGLERSKNINFQKENLLLKQENEKIRLINTEALKRIDQLVQMIGSQIVLGDGIGVD